MSVIINGNTYLDAFSNTKRQQYYMSTYYSLVNDKVTIEYKNPIVDNKNPDFKIDYYWTDFGTGDPLILSSPTDVLSTKYIDPGTYYISYSAVYNNGATYPYVTKEPFIVKPEWTIYDQNNIRLNEEINLTLPYTLEQINIQPNEWGVEDIFNTSIYRLQDCLDYLISNTQTINTYAPTIYFGWLGNNAGNLASGIKWFTQSYNYQYVNRTDLATTGGTSYFTNVIDAKEFDDYLFVLDNNQLRIFENKAVPKEIIFSNTTQLLTFLINPISLDITYSDTGYTAFIADQISNNVYKLNINIDKKDINIQLFIGGFGSLLDHNSFNSPLQVCYSNDNVYVLDYNNYGIKQYNIDLNWIYTYSINDFINDKPISIAAHNNGLIYVLTEQYNVYIFDNKSNDVFEKIPVYQAQDKSGLSKISFSENGDFFFILTEQNVYKYSISGSYITTLSIPKKSNIIYSNIKKGKNGSILLTSANCILKCQDVLEIFKLGEGLAYQYWTKDQLKVHSKEFTSDIVYNRALVRMTNNIKNFRDTLNAKFILATEHTQSNVITYFSYLPINVSDRPVFSSDIENENIGVGVNELHVPQVFNKEFKKIYDALLQLNDFLAIHNYTVNNEDCKSSFCWSWDAMSCYNLSLPVIKTCKINPISYYELKLNQTGNIVYAPNTTWGSAISKCCQKDIQSV
jgi:hypothetical protein